MCGLIGLAASTPQPDRAWLRIAREVLTHRGPDDAGEWGAADGRVGLAHRRLSILDISHAGHQPMISDSGRLCIVFNGEIYNHQDLRRRAEGMGPQAWRGHSDTETLLACIERWGMEETLKHARGMFALAVYDAQAQQLHLARDRAGEKPLFYRLELGQLWFASELKALLSNPALPRRIDREALDCYLAMGFVPGDRCILQGYNKLPPAHGLTFDLQTGSHRLWRYWELPPLEPRATAGEVDEAALLNELEALLEDAVGQQLVADVPVGILLSGGVDSSLVTAMAVRRSRHVRTFSIGFPGHGRLDETPHARLVARHFGTEHTELMAEPATADLIPLLARLFDEPMVDSSMIPTYLVSRLVRQHCTVALGGDGGDELFGGYDYYSSLLHRQRCLAFVPAPLRKAVAWSAGHLLPVGIKGRNYLQALDVDLKHGLPLIARYFDTTTRRRLLRDHWPWPAVAAQVLRERVPAQSDLLQRATRMDFANYLAEDILVKVDRASMLNSLEVRAPLLDHRVIEFAFGRVPSHLKATASQKKILLKRLTERLLPPEFDRQRKQGFSIPLADWLKSGPFRDLFWDVLSRRDGLFDRKTVQGLLRGQDQGFSNSERLFALVQFELWRKAYSVSF